MNEILQDLFGRDYQNHIYTYPQLSQVLNMVKDKYMFVQTTCGKRLIFDEQDYEILRRNALFLAGQKKQVMCVSSSKNGNKTSKPVVKLLMAIDGSCVIKYKNGNYLDIRRENIEVINHQKAHFSQKKTGKPTYSKYKGVSFRPDTAKWYAHIKVNYKKIHLGYFTSEIDAAKAYNEAASEHFGENYSSFNIIEY